MKQCTLNSTSFGISQQCRLDPKYLAFVFKNNWSVFNSPFSTVPLSEVLKPFSIKKMVKGDLQEEVLLINISDQNPGDGILDDSLIEPVSFLGSDKTILSGCDIMISKLGMSKGYIYLCPVTDLTKAIVGSTEFIPYTLLNKKHSLFYLYLLLNPQMLNTYACLESGKTPSHKRVNPNELLKIQIPKIDDDRINSVIPNIKSVVKQIEELKTQIRPTQDIIDDIFAKEFGFDYKIFEELKTHKRFIKSVNAFANNPDLRFSAKFHRDAGTYVMDQLLGITDKKIKHYLSEPIVLGASVSPNDYSDDGDYYYISMATIKNWNFSIQEARSISNEYANSKQAKVVQKNDIIMARSGEGTIGKVALIVEDDLKGIFADFIMRIRLVNYNYHFAYYYFRTSYFQYLVEVYKKGLGNNTNIFPVVIKEFPIPDITCEEQQCIVDKIQLEIGKQDEINLQTTGLRKQIDKIVEDLIYSE